MGNASGQAVTTSEQKSTTNVLPVNGQVPQVDKPVLRVVKRVQRVTGQIALVLRVTKRVLR